jgi:DNA-binding NtrC family response regulator
MSDNDVKSFSEAIERLEVTTLSACNLWEARNSVTDDILLDVVVTDLSLPDGNWSDVLRWTVDRRHQANVVVRTPIADEYLWAEVLWRGGYDLLVSPYGPEEIRRVIEGAWRSLFPSELRSPSSPPSKDSV